MVIVVASQVKYYLTTFVNEPQLIEEATLITCNKHTDSSDRFSRVNHNSFHFVIITSKLSLKQRTRNIISKLELKTCQRIIFILAFVVNSMELYLLIKRKIS